MRYEDDLLRAGMADGDLALLPAGVVRVRKGQREWIEEDRSRILEGDTVLVEVALCLLRIPLIDYMPSLAQLSEETKRPGSAPSPAVPPCGIRHFSASMRVNAAAEEPGQALWRTDVASQEQ